MLIPNDSLRIVPHRYSFEIFEESFPQHQNSAIAQTEVLFLAVCNCALTGPSYEILIHDVTIEPPSSGRIFDRTMPRRNRSLLVWLLFLRNELERPCDAQRVFVVNGHTPFEMTSGE